MSFEVIPAEITLQDMKLENMLTDYCRDDGCLTFGDKTRSALRAQGKLRYAIIDYNVSFMVPPEIKHEEYTLPYFKAWIGTWIYQPYDNQQGEHEYNPFAYDVGALGMMFCNLFQVILLYNALKKYANILCNI